MDTVRNQNRFVINVWAGISGTHVIGPYFLQANQNAENYSNFAREELPNLLEIAGFTQEDQRNLWFMQDGHPAHASNIGIQAVRALFRRKIISARTEFEWPPRSPDLTPCDFFLWGYVKEVTHIIFFLLPFHRSFVFNIR